MYCLFWSALFLTRVDRKGEKESSNVKDAYVMIKHSAFQLSLCCSYLLPTTHTQSHNWWSDRPALWNILLCKQLVVTHCWSMELATVKWWGSIGLVGVGLFWCFSEKWALNWINGIPFNTSSWLRVKPHSYLTWCHKKMVIQNALYHFKDVMKYQYLWMGKNLPCYYFEVEIFQKAWIVLYWTLNLIRD